MASFRFLPKGEVAGEGTEVERKAGLTRPRGLMNTNAKVVQASVAHGLSEHVVRHARMEQRGFLRRRQLVQNVLEVDTRMRIEGLGNSLCAIPAAICWDFTAAFSTADHAILCEAMG